MFYYALLSLKAFFGKAVTYMMEETHHENEVITIDEDYPSKVETVMHLKKLKRRELKELKKLKVEEDTKLKKENALKQMKYLLQHSEKYSQYILKKLQKDK